MFIIDTQSKTPIFEQLKKQILEFISIGALSAGDKLPSVRSLANELGVNPNTVAKAYAELEEQKYIYTEKGRGCFVSNQEADKVIYQEKLKQFQETLQDMYRHKVKKEDLLQLMNDVYKEGQS